MIASNQLIKLCFTRFLLSCFFLSCASISFTQTPCVNGMAAGFPCDKVDLMSFMPLSELGATATNDIWGWTSPETNREYAIVGLRNGYAFIDMTDPVNPVRIGNLPSNSGSSTWGDIKVDENYAYLVSEASGHHIQVFNLLQLDDVTNPPITFEDSGLVTIGNGNAHNIVVDEESNFVYSVGTRSLCGGGPVAFDVSNPATPVLEGCFSADGYSHDAMCFVYKGADMEHIGKQICIGFNENTFTVVDVSNKRKPVELSREGYEHVSYTHQGWMTDDHRYLLLNDELDEQDENVNTSTYIFDLADLDNPVYLDTHFGNSVSIDHNLYVKGNYAYESNYAEGLRIKDMSDIANGNLTEVAFFDFYPEDDNAQFVSIWSSYPYFKSGNIPVSDLEQGLFIVRPQLPHFDMDIKDNGGFQKICEGADAVFKIDLTAYADFDNPVHLSVSGLPSGAVAAFTNNDIIPDNDVSPVEDVKLTISGLQANTKHSFTLTAEGDDSPMHQRSIAVAVLPKDGHPTPLSPDNNAINLPITTALNWSSTSEFSTYDVEVATDVDFTQVIFSETDIEGLGVTLKDLAPATTYYWRAMTASTPCNTNFVESGLEMITSSFTTADFDCVSSSNSTSTGFPIIGSPVIVSTINIAQGGSIANLNISGLDITHPNVGNLEVTLTSPALTTVTLFTSPSGGTCDQDNLLLGFNDFAFKTYDDFNNTCDHSDNESNMPPEFDTHAINNTYRPMNSLTAFNGEDMQGAWVLRITDLGVVDGGTLNEWTLEMCTSEDIILDLDLLDFKAEPLQQSILVSWETAQTFNHKTYQLQRSLLANANFATIATIEANDQRLFKYEDTKVKTGTIYFYRLVQIDHAGKTETSKVVEAKLSSESDLLQLIPNPASEGVQIVLENWEATTNAQISLMTLDGRLIKTEQQTAASHYLALKDLASGVYLVKVQLGNSVMIKRLMVR